MRAAAVVLLLYIYIEEEVVGFHITEKKNVKYSNSHTRRTETYIVHDVFSTMCISYMCIMYV